MGCDKGLVSGGLTLGLGVLDGAGRFGIGEFMPILDIFFFNCIMTHSKYKLVR